MMFIIFSYGQVLVKGFLNTLFSGTNAADFRQPSRTLIQYSRLRGRRKTVHTVISRFYRLNWGAWIRTYGGRHKGLYKKSEAEQRRLRQHIFCNATQSRMFDKMVTKFWRKPTYYVDDIYEPYQKRDNFWITRGRGG